MTREGVPLVDIFAGRTTLPRVAAQSSGRPPVVVGRPAATAPGERDLWQRVIQICHKNPIEPGH